MHNTSRRWLLREQTADAHAAVDAVVGAFVDLSSYKAYLTAMAAFRAPIESQLDRIAWPTALWGWHPNRVAKAISLDIQDLDMRPLAASAGEFNVTGDRLYGALYVLEGSTLGAKILFRRAEAIGLSASFGARHLALLSQGVDAWRGFLDRLEKVEPFDLTEAIEASHQTFAHARAAFEAHL